MKKSSTTLNIFTGIFLGLLIGLMLGLSISEIVGAVASVLVAGAAVFMGMHENSKSGEFDGPKLFRILFLSLFCIIGIFTGIIFRTHNILGSSSLKNDYSDYIGIGFTEEEAREIIRNRLINSGGSGEADDRTNGTILYSDEIPAGIEDLKPSSFTSAEAAIKAFRAHSEKLADFADFVEKNFRPEDYQNVMQYHWDFLTKK